MEYSVVEKVPDAFLVTYSKVSIGDPMTLVPDPNFQIEPYRHRLPLVTECPRNNFNAKFDALGVLTVQTLSKNWDFRAVVLNLFYSTFLFKICGCINIARFYFFISLCLSFVSICLPPSVCVSLLASITLCISV